MDPKHKAVKTYETASNPSNIERKLSNQNSHKMLKLNIERTRI